MRTARYCETRERDKIVFIYIEGLEGRNKIPRIVSGRVELWSRGFPYVVVIPVLVVVVVNGKISKTIRFLAARTRITWKEKDIAARD